MTPSHRRAALICLTGAGGAFGGAIALGGARVFAVVHDVLEIYAGDRGAPARALDFRLVALVALSAGLAIAAVAFAIAGHRAARALERASLIETGA